MISKYKHDWFVKWIIFKMYTALLIINKSAQNISHSKADVAARLVALLLIWSILHIHMYIPLCLCHLTWLLGKNKLITKLIIYIIYYIFIIIYI